MAKADAEPRSPEIHIEQAIGRLYRFLAGNRWTRFPWAVVQTFSRAEAPCCRAAWPTTPSCRCCRC